MVELTIDVHISANLQEGCMESSAASICGSANYLRRKLPEFNHAERRCKRRRRPHIHHTWPSDYRHDAGIDLDTFNANHHSPNDDNEVCTHIMKPSVWNFLPSELIERVLACLPMPSLFRFRAVCRAWNAAPFQPVFKSLRALTMTPEAWLIMLAAPRAEKCTPSYHWQFAFNLEDNKPVALPHTFLPFPPDPGCFSYCAAAGGLICYHLHMGFDANYDENPLSLWVGNPFTKEWKCLPPTIGSFPLNFPLRGLAGMVVLDSANNNAPAKQPVHYKIIVRTGSQVTWGSGMMTEEYDSLTNAWRVTTMGNVPLDHRIEQVVHCNGSLYFLTWQARDGIYAYHMVKQEWTHILPPKRYQFTSPHMVECCGQLVLVSGVGRHHTTRLKGVRRLHIRTTGIELWRLVEKESACTNALADMERAASARASTWRSLSRMPEELVQEFVTGVQFHCTSIENLIYLTNSISMLIFNVVARMWRRVIISQLPFLVQDFVSFVPKLEASP